MNSTHAKGLLSGATIIVSWGIAFGSIAHAETKPAKPALVCSTEYVLGGIVTTCRPKAGK